jgi:hypothetical protein
MQLRIRYLSAAGSTGSEHEAGSSSCWAREPSKLSTTNAAQQKILAFRTIENSNRLPGWFQGTDALLRALGSPA